MKINDHAIKLMVPIYIDEVEFLRLPNQVRKCMSRIVLYPLELRSEPKSFDLVEPYAVKSVFFPRIYCDVTRIGS